MMNMENLHKHILAGVSRVAKAFFGLKALNDVIIRLWERLDKRLSARLIKRSQPG